MAGTAKSKSTIESQMPISTVGGTTVQDVHDFLESVWPTEVSLTDADQTLNIDDKPVSRITLGGNRAITIAGGHNGTTATLYVYQDATGNRVPTFPSATAANTPTWRTSNSPNIPNVVSFFRSNGTTYYFVS